MFLQKENNLKKTTTLSKDKTASLIAVELEKQMKNSLNSTEKYIKEIVLEGILNELKK